MAEPEDIDDDLFADLYDGDENESRPANDAPAAPPQAAQAPTTDQVSTPDPGPSFNHQLPADAAPAAADETYQGAAPDGTLTGSNGMKEDTPTQGMNEHGFTATVGIKEDGKMFIGGLNWETTDQSLKDYFSQFGEVSECTVMRDGMTGRSRGFGFLTFKDPKTVNIVMVKEHYLDGKIIDPKRAIPRDEQEKTSKIFVGGVSQEATERDFETFFAQFGRVVDATLMMDKDTGRPRGFGFVTFEGEAAVEATLAQPLEILGKPIEVKRAQPRGNLREEEANRGGRAGQRGQNDRFNRQDSQGAANENQQNAVQQTGPAGMNGMSPQMMAQYWQRMQQYFALMQQQISTNMAQGQQQQQMANMNMNGMNPAMMQQMMAMQQQQGQQQPMNPGQDGSTGSGPQSPGPQNMGVQEQLAFEQRKYEQQQARRGGSASWEGMYDDAPQQSGGHHGGHYGGRGRGDLNRGNHNGFPQPTGQAPANAPTGPRNAGRPGANYRGGGRGGHRGYHPYSRK